MLLTSPESSDIIPHSQQQQHPFVDVHAMFRDDVFLLNTQLHPILTTTTTLGDSKKTTQSTYGTGLSFDLKDSNHWLPFPVRQPKFLRHPGTDLRLSPTTLDSHSTRRLEIQIESDVKEAIISYRTELGLQSHFSEQLAIVLQSALLSYEIDRSLGASVNGNADFQTAVKRCVSHGECFKAYPTCFSSSHSSFIVAALRQASAAREIISTQSSSMRTVSEKAATRLAIRCRIFSYPEGAMAVWLMVGCIFAGP